MSGVVSVSELTLQIKGVFQNAAEFQNIAVRGEISNFSRPVSGHLYFTLKDDKARLRVVMFAGKARFLRFQMRDGMRVIVQGALDVFERSGDYQLYAEAVQPDGIGALYLAFEELKQKLEQEGLFQGEKKLPLPKFPQRIALITSATGAAVRDMVTTLNRRYPLGHVYIVPVAVQGDDAPAKVSAGIHLVNKHQLADVIIVGRGGGSFEELYAFNTELVARAISESELPVISAVGHETDVTISDFVSDVRAATPTAAAELATPNVIDLSSHIENMAWKMQSLMENNLKTKKDKLQKLLQNRHLTDPMHMTAVLEEQLDVLERLLEQYLSKKVQQGIRVLSELELRLARIPVTHRLDLYKAQLESLKSRLEIAVEHTYEARQQKLDHLLDKLEILNPLSVMRRGYAVVFRSDKSAVVTKIDQVQPGESLHVEVAGGWLDCQVWGVHEKSEQE